MSKHNKNYKVKTSAISWLASHCDKKTGEPFLSYANEYAAEKFSILCEKMVQNYKLSRWDDYIELGHFNNSLVTLENPRQTLQKALKILGDDAVLTADIIIRNYSLPKAERKHNIARGKAKVKLRKALDKLADLFGIHKDYREKYEVYD